MLNNERNGFPKPTSPASNPLFYFIHRCESEELAVQLIQDFLRDVTLWGALLANWEDKPLFLDDFRFHNNLEIISDLNADLDEYQRDRGRKI